MKNKKVFLIINSYYIGDILLANPLAQNIKRIYDDAYVVMLTPPSMVDVAKYQKCVDDVVVWDRHGEHHGWFNMFKFILSFPYKNIYAAFPIYSGDRAIMLAGLLRAKYILGLKKGIIGILLKSKYKIQSNMFQGTQGRVISMLSGITQEKLINCPIKPELPNIETEVIKEIEQLHEEFITLSPTSSNIIKDMPIEDVGSIIETSPYKVVLLGKGNSSQVLSENLAKKNYKNLIDLTNKTSYLELAQIINMSKGCISVDTGSLHLACGLNKPTVGVFYNKHNWGYKPDSDIYPKTFCSSDLKPDEIVNKLSELMNR